MNDELTNYNIYNTYKIKTTDFTDQYIDITKYKLNLIYKDNRFTLGENLTTRYMIEGKNNYMKVSTNLLTVISKKHDYSSLLEKLKLYNINHYDFNNSKYYRFKLEKVLPTDYALYENDKLLSIHRNRLELINSHTKITPYIILFLIGIIFFGYGIIIFNDEKY